MNKVDHIDPQDHDRKTLEILNQQVDNLITKEGGAQKTVGPGVKYSKLYCLADNFEIFLMVSGWIYAVLAGLGMPFFAYIFGDILDAFSPTMDPDEMLDDISRACLLITVLGAGMWFFSYLYYAHGFVFSERIAFKTRTRYLEAILQQESAWYDLINPQELASRLKKEVLHIQRALGEKMGTAIMALAMTLAGLVFAFTKGWTFTFVMLASFPPLMISTNLLTVILQGGFIQGMKAYGQSAGYAEQALNAIRVVVAFGQEEKETHNYSRFLADAKKEGVKIQCKAAIVMGFFMASMFATYAYTFFMGGIWIYNEFHNSISDAPYTSGDILSVFFGVLFGMFSLGMAAPNIKSISEGLVAGKMVYDVIDRVPSIQADDTSASHINLRGQIEFKNISFVYPSRPDQKVLSDFSANFEIGKTTALVGPSGSGKSTVVQLLERFYDPSEGQVLIDGMDLKTISLKNYRHQVGYVGQEPILFNTTIKKNILFGKPDATDDEIIEALKNANAYDFVMSHEEGINLHVGQSGGQLSGGQKQRIAIARAFIKKPKVLIFDEATSALDTKNEREVQKAIDSIKKQLGQVTTIVIAHRLTTIQNADTILVLKKGKIIEKGNHQSLLQNYPQGVYSGLVKQQQSQEVDSQEDDVQLDKKNSWDDDGPQDIIESVPMMKKQSTRRHRQSEYAAEERKMKEMIDQKDKEQEEIDAEELRQIEKVNFGKRLSPYNKPMGNAIIGVTMSCVNGSVFPICGYLLGKAMFTMMIPDKEEMRDETWKFALYMFVVALGALFSVFIVRFCFGVIGENITLNIRTKMYSEVLKKSISWFDMKENAAGVLTSVLASDAAQLQGASIEGLGIMIESTFGMIIGIIIAMILSWEISLICIGLSPFMMIGGAINAKFQAGFSEHDEVAYKEADLLSGDSIMNQKTVSSFGRNEIIIQQYEEYLMPPHLKAKKQAHMIGITFGFSQFIQNAVIAALFWIGCYLIFKVDRFIGEQENIMVAIFSMMFGAFAAGQAQQFGPDVGKAKKAASKIFKYIDTKSKINAVDIPGEQMRVPENFKGMIEFRNVWFRYPSRKNEWVFKGLNLKINCNESVAIVGESGCGKSTLVNLILRFYDPCHGEVLMDGVNVKDFNLRELRRKMGMVMQEPTLFNYTIKENILYGKSDCTDSEIREAADIANALEFIESQELFELVDDSAHALLQAFTDKRDIIVPHLGEAKYNEKIEALKFLEQKEQKQGKFKPQKGIMDTRDPQRRDIQLHQGFEIDCGLRGGKLSGGQKQRIAIARAVIRKPQILILDEATSALDENSQMKVQKALENIMDNRTSIVIAHRLSTVEKCNRIVVLENGKVVEDGSVDELKKNEEGHFAKLQQNMKKQEKKERKQSL